MQWHQLDHMQTICTTLQTDNYTNISSLNFYTPDALPEAPTNSVRALKAHIQYETATQCRHFRKKITQFIPTFVSNNT